ncbi:MAG TPA: IclR family transcriptional regulator [Amycolatopsis sp.]|uniref:IclR family transcriptional regulator n=1 Tax=Amycolatopsis sp. TaxID=37632 RepID=UPI002B49602F|nr:IclR family transcriptional regulator [Amycolatopsis sp.]HKS47500.1 IclR family transcriptional regulator [Amycolatopsis sp.]
MSNDQRTAGSRADNVLRVLVLLSERGKLRVVDVAEELGVARSTAHRLLTSLRGRNFVIQDAQHVYHAGPVFTKLGLSPTRTTELVTTVHPLLEEARARTSETCHLAVLEGYGVRFLDCAESMRPLRVGSKVGMLLPAHNNSAGRALLAELPPPAFAALYSRGVPGVPGSARESRAALRRELTGVRRRGYATNFDESEQGITAIGVPLRDRTGRAFAALAIVSPSIRSPRAKVTEYARTLLDIAERVPSLFD